MAANGQCFVEWKEQFVSKERGKRVVHYFLKDISGESVLAVVGTERSVRHMFYVVAEEFLKVNEAENSVNAGYRWRSRREVVNWLTSMLSKQHRQGEHSKSPKSDHIPGVAASYQNRLARNLKLRTPDIVWSGVAWTCGKQLKHFPAFCRNGITIAVQSFVFVMAEEEKRHLAYLEDMYEDRKGQKKVKVRWFHHNQEVQVVVTLRNPHPKEVFITPYAQVISVECVDGPAIVLTREHYEKCVSVLPEDLLTRVHLCLRQFKNNRVKPFKLSKLCGYFDQPIFSILDTEYIEDEEHSPGDNVKVGVKRPRSSRGRQVVVPPYDPSCMNLKYEMLRRRLIPKYVKNQALYTPFFKANEKIELLCQDSGIRGCWFRCTVLQVTRKRLEVQYDDLKDEDGSGNLEEWVSALRLAMPDKLGMRYSGRPTLRPAHLENETNVAFEVGSPVDAWWSDGWWEGVVTGISDESGDGNVRVYVPSETLFLELHRKNIRVSKDWVGDHWVDLETKPNIHSLIPADTGPNVDETKPESLPISSKETPASNDPPESNNDKPLQEDDIGRKAENDLNPSHDDNDIEIAEKGLNHEAE
ncbi:uncharacterized protein LOC112514938 [Cynara cardunculus var. scolymus]|uniref:uncharacterized protein LOC112514938 n=1 Tax=Cynara cardunculus var. scolymus TaxID=59895 RepID=UPI000D62B744|nr:uncharacterized protein LOC112514938 [Cynara cardunculus var. scolymus]